MKSFRISLLILASGISNLIAQTNGIDQTLDFVAPLTGGKFVSWHAKTGRSYFLQVSDPTAHLHKWNWSTVIERGQNQTISYEVDSTADKGFFRLHYTDQTATNLETADFDNDGLTNLQEITPVSGIGGVPTQTNPLNGDTDADGLGDKFERDNNLDPTDNGSTNPNNGPNGDPDGDGIPNINQQAAQNPPAGLTNSEGYGIETETTLTQKVNFSVNGFPELHYDSSGTYLSYPNPTSDDIYGQRISTYINKVSGSYRIQNIDYSKTWNTSYGAPGSRQDPITTESTTGSLTEVPKTPVPGVRYLNSGTATTDRQEIIKTATEYTYKITYNQPWRGETDNIVNGVKIGVIETGTGTAVTEETHTVKLAGKITDMPAAWRTASDRADTTNVVIKTGPGYYFPIIGTNPQSYPQSPPFLLDGNDTYKNIITSQQSAYGAGSGNPATKVQSIRWRWVHYTGPDEYDYSPPPATFRTKLLMKIDQFDSPQTRDSPFVPGITTTKSVETIELPGGVTGWQNLDINLTNLNINEPLGLSTAQYRDTRITQIKATLLPIEVAVRKKGEVVPQNGVLVKTGDILEIALTPQLFEADDDLESFITWQFRQRKANGIYENWANFGSNGTGTKFEHPTATGGIFQIKAIINNGEEYKYARKKDEKLGTFQYGSGKKDDPDCVGVCDTQIQIDICREAQNFYGSEAYSAQFSLSAQYGFPEYPASGNSIIRCNIFVAHRATAAGAVVPKINGFFNEYPPLANEWAGIEDTSIWPGDPTKIAGWPIFPSTTHPQPGWIIAHPNPGDAGHCAVTDYDGEGIGAGISGTVNKKYNEPPETFWDGTSRCRKYTP